MCRVPRITGTDTPPPHTHRGAPLPSTSLPDHGAVRWHQPAGLLQQGPAALLFPGGVLRHDRPVIHGETDRGMGGGGVLYTYMWVWQWVLLGVAAQDSCTVCGGVGWGGGGRRMLLVCVAVHGPFHVPA